MKTRIVALGLWCGIVVPSALALDIEGFDPDRSVEYKKVGDVSLKIHIFEPEGHKPTDSTPAIVFFFGGGWNSGSPSQFFPQCTYLASRGMVALSADYRVRSRNQTTPRECVMDGKSAIRWVRAHAEELGVDPGKIAAGGGSAGGHVAAAVATVKGFEEAGEDGKVRCTPDALVLFNPVYDNGPGGFGHDRVKAYWREISPMHSLDAKTPPTTVFLGTKDDLIPVKTAEEYQKKMRDLGLRSDLHLYEGQPHGFFNFTRNKQAYGQTLVEMDKFLASLGYLKGEPTWKE